jgi:hypothetical protein
MRRAHSAAAADIGGRRADAFAVDAEPVMALGQADRLRGGDDGVAKLRAAHRDGEGKRLFHRGKGARHGSAVPSLRAIGGPGVVILALAADIDEAVDGARAAQRAAAHPPDAARFGMLRLRFGRIGPGQHGIAHEAA